MIPSASQLPQPLVLTGSRAGRRERQPATVRRKSVHFELSLARRSVRLLAAVHTVGNSTPSAQLCDSETLP
jgi:hypothetical protein